MPWRYTRLPANLGLSLVELLVALVLGVVLTFGAMNLLLQSKRSYIEAEELARLQENGRFALRYLSHELVMAGYLASLVPGTEVDSVEAGTACFDYLMDTLRPLEYVNDVTRDGESGSGDHDLPADCLVARKHLAGTDLLVIRRTAGSPALTGGDELVPVDADAIYLRTDSGGAAPRLQRGGADDGVDGELWEYVPEVLYLRDYSVVSGDGIPALCRKRLGRSSNDMAPSECLVEGIENLQLEFGIDESGDELADRFDSAPDPAGLTAAVAIRIHLLVRSVRPLPGHVDARSFLLGGTEVAAAGDGHFRRLMQTTILLRNRAGFSP